MDGTYLDKAYEETKFAAISPTRATEQVKGPTTPRIDDHINILAEANEILREATKILDDRFRALHGVGPNALLDLAQAADKPIDSSIHALSNEARFLASRLRNIIVSL